MGDIPCLFGTLTSQRYHWDEVIRIIAEVEGIEDYHCLSKGRRRQLVNKYPLFVAWYCSVKLELTLKCVVVPTFGTHAYVAVFEWSPTGGMVHLHYILWKRGAPRFDAEAAGLLDRARALRQAGLVAGGEVTCDIKHVVDFFSDYINEWNPNKGADGEEEVPTSAAGRKPLVAGQSPEPSPHTASLSLEEILDLLRSENSHQRFAYYKRAVTTEHMHDFHYPDPLGPPNPAQPCAHLLKGTLNMWYCGNGYPRDLVCQPCDRSVAQDALRPDLWRVSLCRNCQLMNPHMPIPTLVLQSNTDATPVVTRHQAVMYCCKYCSKHGKRQGQASVLYEVLDDMDSKDASAKNQHGDDYVETKLGSKLHRAFMAEIGEEMCQAEVAHHANKGPEYLCSRPQKYVHLYKQALAVNIRTRQPRAPVASAICQKEWDWQEEGDTGWNLPGVTTQRSDIELYESRIQYYFWPEGTRISANLPPKDTSEEQVAAATLWEFFRFVRFHGGRQPYLEWHDDTRLPVVVLSPTVKLTEGADFAFGARWALMQHHAWTDRKQFLDMSDDEVKRFFRDWRVTPQCPWYIQEQYLTENGRRAHGGAGAAERPSKSAGGVRLSEEEYKARIEKLVKEEDYEGASALQYQQKLAKEDGGLHSEDENNLEAEEEAAPLNSDSEDSAACLQHKKSAESTHVLRMLYQGSVEEVARGEVQSRKAKVFNRKHGYYKKTWVTSTAQETASVHPGAGAVNIYEDSSDGDAYTGEQKEIAKEMDALRVAHQWINQEGWDAESHSRVLSPATGQEIWVDSHGDLFVKNNKPLRIKAPLMHQKFTIDILLNVT